jgi:chromosome segregation ATPase
MKTIEHEGKTYVLQSDVESQKASMEQAFKDRISKISSRAIQAEEQAKTLQEQLDNQSGKLQTLDTLNNQIRELGEQLAKSESKYSRHLAIAEMGFQDEDMRDMVEWSYEKATKGMDKAPSLMDWLGEIKKDPSKAPKVLAPHLQTSKESTPETIQEISSAAPQEELPAILPPKTNKGAQSAPVKSTDLLKRGAEDFDFYRANRESIRKAWKSR